MSSLGKARVHPKLAQALARHSTINLTMNVYAHVALDEKAEAVASLPAPWSPTADGGADDSNEGPANTVVPCAVPCGAQDGAQRMTPVGPCLPRDGNAADEEGADQQEDDDCRKSCSEGSFGNSCHQMTTPGTEAGRVVSEVHPSRFERETFGSVGRK